MASHKQTNLEEMLAAYTAKRLEDLRLSPSSHAQNNGVQESRAAGLEASGTGGDEGEESSAALLEAMKQFQEKEEQNFAQESKELEFLRHQLDLPLLNRFNYRKVPTEIKNHTRSLPIYQRKEEIIKTVRENQIVILVGDTGSGKSTQLPQYLVEAGFCDGGNGIIGITQPRRVAAKSLAQRVCKEGGVKLGTLVGYAVRFDKCLSGSTLVKFMTDGLLVKEVTVDQNLTGYSVIIIDEAHERSVDTDVCFGLLKAAAAKRPDLKIIISSATLDESKFRKYFNYAPLIKVEGKMHPVDIIYKYSPVADVVTETAVTIQSIHKSKEEGDILAFLSGQDEIEMVWDQLEQVKHLFSKEMIIMPCYGALPFEEQQKIFETTPENCRKVVLATNIAETSLTIDGIVFVIDSGYFKQNYYDARTKIETLKRKRITKFQAIQRMGRAGRTRPGKCHRLYTEREYAMLKEAPKPDITRCNVQSVILDLMAMGIKNPLKFDFMNSPPTDAMMTALQHLRELTALDSKLQLTPLGKQMASFPLDPPLSRVLIESAKLGCSSEVIKIVAMLSTQSQNIFYRGKKVRTKADQVRAKYNQPEGDHLTLLKVYDAWVLNHMSEAWARTNYINHRILEEAEEIRIQLTDIARSQKLEISSGGRSNDPHVKTNIRRAFTSGYFRQLAKKSAIGYAYQALSEEGSNGEVYLHPTSALFSKKPAEPWLIFHEVLVTKKAYMTGAITIEPEWIKIYAPEFAAKVMRIPSEADLDLLLDDLVEELLFQI